MKLPIIYRKMLASAGMLAMAAMLLTTAEGCGEKEEPIAYEFNGDEADYTLIWSDEFDGEALDLTKWSYQTGDGGDYGNVGWGNGESQIYTDSENNVSVKDGVLTITAIKEKNHPEGHSFTSGRIRTITDDNEVLFATTYGRVEARARMEGGEGIWPAFWMLPVDPNIYGTWAASGELDIMEIKGRLPDRMNGTAHFGRMWPDNVYKGSEYSFPEGSDVHGYHVYAIDWTPTEISWYVDDECYFSLKNWYSEKGANATKYTNPAPFDVPFYILLNVAIGGNFDPEAIVNEESFPAKMDVDYVRVYQKNGGYEEEIAEANGVDDKLSYDEYKKPTNQGNMVYNGTFDQGTNHMGFWHAENLDARVLPEDTARMLTVTGKAGATETGKVWQTGFALETGKNYGIHFTAVEDGDMGLVVRLVDKDGNAILEKECQVPEDIKKGITVTWMPEVDYENVTLEIEMSQSANIKIDNVLFMDITNK